MSQATLKQRMYLLEEMSKVRDMSFDEASKCIGAAKGELESFHSDKDFFDEHAEV